MKWLLWKDYRHNRLIVLAALFFLLTPHLVGLCVMIGAHWIPVGTHNGQPVYGRPEWKQVFVVSSLYSIGISQIGVALIAGNAIAGERVDRSAEFLFSLPISRRRIFTGKLLLATVIAAIVWLPNVPIIVCWMDHLQPLWRMGPQDVLRCFTNIASASLVIFGVAWFLSSFINSPAFAACGGIITPIIIVSGVTVFDTLLEMHVPAVTIWFVFRTICLALAAISFGIGTWHYLRRVEP